MSRRNSLLSTATIWSGWGRIEGQDRRTPPKCYRIAGDRRQSERVRWDSNPRCTVQSTPSRVGRLMTARPRTPSPFKPRDRLYGLRGWGLNDVLWRGFVTPSLRLPRPGYFQSVASGLALHRARPIGSAATYSPISSAIPPVCIQYHAARPERRGSTSVSTGA